MARREPLSREKVLEAALTLASSHGLETLSMRRLGKELGVEAMSLYNHVASKSDLLDGMAERLYAATERADPTLPWSERVRVTALNLHRALRGHPAVVQALAADQANPTSAVALRPIEDILAALASAGFDLAGQRRALHALNSLIFGSLLLSTAGFGRAADAGHDVEQIALYRDRLDPAEVPHLRALLPTLPSSDTDREFQEALALLLRGLCDGARDAGRRTR